MLLSETRIDYDLTPAVEISAFGEYCLFCLKKLSEQKSLVLRECENAEYGHGAAWACEDCYQEHRHEQKKIAFRILSDYMNDYDLDILEDDTDYYEYSNCFYIDTFSDIYSPLCPDAVFVAADIVGTIEVGVRSEY
jgi:hypothetical protein